MYTSNTELEIWLPKVAHRPIYLNLPLTLENNSHTWGNLGLSSNIFLRVRVILVKSV